MRLPIFIASLLFSFQTLACDITYTVNVNTYGSKVLVELRSGMPGQSTVIKSQSTRGGKVEFKELCPGQIFFAVGDDESVDVTPPEFIESNNDYRGEPRWVKTSSNVKKKKRSAL